MLAHTIDSNGYMLEPVMVADSTKDGDKWTDGNTIIVTRCPDGLYRPQWSGTVWSDAQSLTNDQKLDAAKQARIAYLESQYASTLAAGYTCNATGTTYTYDLKPSDDRAWRKLKDAIDLGAYPATGYPLKCIDSTGAAQYITHTQAQAQTVLQAGANFELNQESNLRTKINDVNAVELANYATLQDAENAVNAISL